MPPYKGGLGRSHDLVQSSGRGQGIPWRTPRGCLVPNGNPQNHQTFLRTVLANDRPNAKRPLLARSGFHAVRRVGISGGLTTLLSTS